MDNFYNATTFCKRAFTHRRKFKVYGVTRKRMHGTHMCVKQEEEITRNNQISVRGKVKVVILGGDPKCPNMIASNVYDVKNVRF